MLNAFALRATNSGELYRVADPVGIDNDRWIREIAAGARLVIAAWGRPGGTLGRGAQVTALLKASCDPVNVRCFGFNRDGTPIHPLYQRETIAVTDLTRLT